MAMEIPAWLDTSFVQRILRDAEKDKSIEVSHITVKAATAKGDNYGSDMHRVGVEFSRLQDGREIREQRSLIVKVAPQGDVREKVIEASGVFVTELPMMSVTLPLMSEILENVCPMSLAAQCVSVHEKPTYIVMEDLAPRGFLMADRRTGLDLDHCLLAFRNLGRFHAASIALKENDPDALTKYVKGMFHKDQPPEMAHYFNLAAKTLAGEVAKWSELDPRIEEKILKLSEVLFEKACEASSYREDDFNVLNHGDFWVNNMLFRYDEHQKPTDHIFVDFQVSHYGSPAVDLLYFFATSPTNEIRLNHRELLLHEYHASLTSTMAKLKCSTVVLSLDHLRKILRNRAFYEVVAAIVVLPAIVVEKDKEIDYEEMIRLGEKYENLSYRGESYRKIMTRLLPLYDSMGLLDV